MWVMSDANNDFMSRFEFYLGHQNDEGEHRLGYNVVIKFSENIRYTHRFLFFVNFFTSIPLMEHLLMHGHYGVGLSAQTGRGTLRT